MRLLFLTPLCLATSALCSTSGSKRSAMDSFGPALSGLESSARSQGATDVQMHPMDLDSATLAMSLEDPDATLPFGGAPFCTPSRSRAYKRRRNSDPLSSASGTRIARFTGQFASANDALGSSPGYLQSSPMLQRSALRRSNVQTDLSRFLLVDTPERPPPPPFFAAGPPLPPPPPPRRRLDGRGMSTAFGKVSEDVISYEGNMAEDFAMKGSLSSVSLATHTSTEPVRSYFDSQFRTLMLLHDSARSEVHACRNRIDGARYAVKRVPLPSSRFHPALLHEAHVHAFIDAELASPHIVRYHNSWIEEGSVYIQTELCEASARSRLPAPGDALKMMRGVLRALAAMHARGVVHNDVKPANVLVCGGNGVFKLADFGNALIVGPDGQTTDGEPGDGAYVHRSLLARSSADALKWGDLFSLAVSAAEVEVQSHGGSASSGSELARTLKAQLEAGVVPHGIADSVLANVINVIINNPDATAELALRALEDN